MAFPVEPVRLTAPMDPSDKVDYRLDLSGMLASGEAFTAVGVVPMTESALLGFTIETGGGYAPSQPNATSLVFWCSVVPARRGDATWNGDGQDCGAEVTGTTNSVPPRAYQRTVVLKVKQL